MKKTLDLYFRMFEKFFKGWKNHSEVDDVVKFFETDAVIGQQEYQLPKDITRIFIANINGLPTNYDVVLRFKRPMRKPGKVSVGVLRKSIDK